MFASPIQGNKSFGFTPKAHIYNPHPLLPKIFLKEKMGYIKIFKNEMKEIWKKKYNEKNKCPRKKT